MRTFRGHSAAIEPTDRASAPYRFQQPLLLHFRNLFSEAFDRSDFHSRSVCTDTPMRNDSSTANAANAGRRPPGGISAEAIRLIWV